MEQFQDANGRTDGLELFRIESSIDANTQIPSVRLPISNVPVRLYEQCFVRMLKMCELMTRTHAIQDRDVEGNPLGGRVVRRTVAKRISKSEVSNFVTMKTVAALALLASTAAAFAPSQQSPASTSLAAFEDALGAQKPLGFW